MNKTTVLDERRVHMIHLDCLHQSDECVSDTRNGVVVEYLSCRGSIFDPQKLEGHREEIVAMLNELPPEFKDAKGTSFRNGYVDNRGNQWTGLPDRVEKLFKLGIALGKVKSLIPRHAGLYDPHNEGPCLVITE